MKVLLISANTEQINMPVLPLGLACVAAATRRAGHDVRLVNLMTQQNSSAVLRDALNRFSPDVIGVSVRNIDDQSMDRPMFLLDSVKNVISQCRNLSYAPIVLGGAGYSIFPDSVLAYLGADMGIQGEGETAFNALLERIDSKEGVSGIPGLVLPGGGEKEEPQRIKNLNKVELPSPDILDSPEDLQEIWLPFQTRRGCPMECSYCSTAKIEGRIIRKREPRAVIDAIARFQRAGFDRLFFVDNTFNLPPSYAEEVCRRIIASQLRISWRCILYPWKVDETLVQLMAEAGCKEVSLGFESGSKRILRAMNKKFEPDEVSRISRLLKQYGIRSMGFLLLGGPGETKETVKESLHFAHSLGLESVKVTVGIRIYPDTLLARTALREGIIEGKNNLLLPTFYLNKNLETWIRESVDTYMKTHPNWHS